MNNNRNKFDNFVKISMKLNNGKKQECCVVLFCVNFKHIYIYIVAFIILESGVIFFREWREISGPFVSNSQRI